MPDQITADTFVHFIYSRRLIVIHAQNGTVLGFNKYLKKQLDQNYKELINTGYINIERLDYREPKVQEFIQIWIPNLGLPSTNSIFPGYYLFKEGNLIAYHPGTIDPTEIDVRADGVFAIVGAVAALFVGILQKSVAKGLQAFIETMLLSTGSKMLHFFKEIIQVNDPEHSKVMILLVFEDELIKAYKLLQVHPDASDEEVEEAWKRRMAEFHPDKSQHDREARIKLSAEIDAAFNLIKAARKKAKSQNMNKPLNHISL